MCQNWSAMETLIVHAEKAQAKAIKAVLKALNMTFEKATENRTTRNL